MFEPVVVDQNVHWKGSLYAEGIRREALAQVISLLDLPHILSCLSVFPAGKRLFVGTTFF